MKAENLKASLELAKQNAMAQLKTKAIALSGEYRVDETLASILLLEGALIGVNACDQALQGIGTPDPVASV